jgi:DNA-binding GntR family transcriptional regulator
VANKESGFLNPPERSSLSERAYLVIRGRILKGEMQLGSSLSRRKVAADLGMSMLPVAEALQRLENEGLVESRPRIGTRVFRPTADDIREHYEIREALESQAARLYAERASVADRLEMMAMAENLDAMFNRVSAGDRDHDFLFAVHSFHMQLHLRIAECTGSRQLRLTIEKNHVLVFNWLFDVAAHRPLLPARHHRTLIEALNEGTPEEADRAMRQHVRYGREDIVRTIGPSSLAPVQSIK